MIKKIKQIGQISVMVAIIGAGATILTSVIGSWITSNNRVSEIDKEMAIVKTTEDLHYKELVDKFGDMNKRFDKLEVLIKNTQ